MTAIDELLPRPPVIRELLAAKRREVSRLRRLLRMSEDVAIERHQQAQRAAQSSQREGGGR